MHDTTGAIGALDFAIIGAQKSASTFVHRCLIDHPEIASPWPEIPVFENMSDPAEIRTKISAMFPDRSKVCGIKRPNYLGTPEVASRIWKTSPGCKIICVLRDPIDRALSAYFHYTKDGFLPVMDPHAGLRLLMDSPLFGELYPRSHEILDFSMYGKHLRAYYDHFPADQVYIMLHDDIQRDPIGQTQALYQFLDVDDQFTPPSKDERPMKVN
ncbi:sulfotransferase family protein [Pseudooceanicola sp.]|uniref:sulfotransferase family protein n=1 Tax=Pseudooceanicola sp. TaxID=1914328 RepID=UPI00405A0142